MDWLSVHGLVDCSCTGCLSMDSLSVHVRVDCLFMVGLSVHGLVDCVFIYGLLIHG